MHNRLHTKICMKDYFRAEYLSVFGMKVHGDNAKKNAILIKE